jgi:hypothetical protein
MTQKPLHNRPNKKRCLFSIDQPYRRIPLDALTMPRRLRRSLAHFFYLSELHGMSRRTLLGLPGLGDRSLEQLEETLAHALGAGFGIISPEDWANPRLPGIAGRPLIEFV